MAACVCVSVYAHRVVFKWVGTGNLCISFCIQVLIKIAPVASGHSQEDGVEMVQKGMVQASSQLNQG